MQQCELGLAHQRDSEQRYLDAGRRTLRAAHHALARYPQAHASLLQALEAELRPPGLVVVRAASSELVRWQEILNRGYQPQRTSLCIPEDAANLPGLLAERAGGPTAVAYICEGMVCQAPITDLAEFERALAALA